MLTLLVVYAVLLLAWSAVPTLLRSRLAADDEAELGSDAGTARVRPPAAAAAATALSR